MTAIRLSTIFLILAIFLMTDRASGQDSRFAESIRNAAIMLDSSALSAYAPFDLQNQLSSNFRVLGIGEQSHGTSEFFKVRMSLIKSLIKSGGLTKIALEAPFAEVENLNEYILHGNRNLGQILKSFRLFNYECKEFVDLVENVKGLNKSTNHPLTFLGIDMQTPFHALQNISESCGENGSATTDSIKKLTEFYRLLDNEIYNHSFNKEDFAELSALSDNLIKNLAGGQANCLKNRLIEKSIKNYRQFLLLNNPQNSYEAQATLRDSLMAENILNELGPTDKIVVLAHNGHIQRTPNAYSKSMGLFLSQKLRTQYQCIGLTTSTGFYTAFTPATGSVTDGNSIPIGGDGTFEYEFSKMQKPVFFFNTSVVKKLNDGAILPNKYKLLPFGLVDQPFISGNLLEDFNYVLHIEKTSGNQSFYLK